MIAGVGRRVGLVVRTVIRALRKANDEQLYMWECLWLTSRTAPVTATGQLRWLPSLDGYRLAGSDLPVQGPSETGP